MITPGLYRHYKNGNLYRVLFVAEWTGRDEPTGDAPVIVGMREIYDAPVELTVGVKNFDTALIVAKWSGNDNNVVNDEPVVIYVSLSDAGRVSARTAVEFAGSIGDGAPSVRFARIGD